MNPNKKSNRLAHQKSPYLLQHAYNPVDWYPWGDDAFDKAKAEDKPIFLSIGYSTCHWCHVMERESFEDEEVAAILNKHFIAIKVDREERPDIDHIYMTFCQAMTGHGGWPLTIIMTPDKKPFFSGTYFPKKSKYGRPGLMDLLNKIQEAWETRRDELEQNSQEISSSIQSNVVATMSGKLSKDVIHTTFNELRQFFDSEYGGFGTTPKFPTPHNLSFLLRYYKATGEQEALNIVEKTLDSMYKGGIFDHLGFGFSRYSVDREWLAPHFEKMLYDNALLAIAYLEAYQLTGNKRYATIADKILTYVLRDMTDEGGAFYSAEDADSEGEEGKFYVWDLKEILEILGDDDGLVFTKYYNITETGNFEGKNIPNLIGTDLEDIEENEKLEERLHKCKEILFEERIKRIQPHKDDKILTAWNGLMIAALGYGGRVLNNEAYIHGARKSAGFILNTLVGEDGRLLARYRDDEAAYLATIDDYAFFIWGLIELYETTFDMVYLEQALRLNSEMLKYFWDENEGGLFIYGTDSEQLLIRPKDIYDGATPSGNSVATLNMLKLGRITGNKELEEKGHQQFQAFGGNVKENPSSYTHFMMAFLFAQVSAQEIIIAGEKEDENTKKMIVEINKRFLPFTTTVLNHGIEALYELVPFAKEQKPLENQSTAYVCENFSCNIPTTDIQQFIDHLLKPIKL